jgi:hypothetical protein
MMWPEWRNHSIGTGVARAVLPTSTAFSPLWVHPSVLIGINPGPLILNAFTNSYFLSLLWSHQEEGKIALYLPLTVSWELNYRGWDPSEAQKGSDAFFLWWQDWHQTSEKVLLPIQSALTKKKQFQKQVENSVGGKLLACLPCTRANIHGMLPNGEAGNSRALGHESQWRLILWESTW